jgi:DNA invertase Pin-like site-specific DNA recombinase
MSADTKKAIGYIRVSTEDQHLGPEAQRAAIQAWCRANGAELAADFEETACSADPIDKRPRLMEAVNAVAEHEATVFVVAKRDRIARDVVLAAMIERLVERAGARIQSADGTGNGDTPEAKLMRTMIDAFAEYERALIRARTKAALAVLRRRGMHTGGQAPYGKRVGSEGALEADEYEQGVIREARRLYRPGEVGLKTVAKRLNDQGFTSRGRRPFQATQVRNMVVG